MTSKYADILKFVIYKYQLGTFHRIDQELIWAENYENFKCVIIQVEA